MTSFESSVSLKQPINQVYDFLSVLNNHSQLMPDEVTDWTGSINDATFEIKNMAKLTINVVSRTENTEILIATVEPSRIKLEMRWAISLINGETIVNLALSAQLSPLLKIMASSAFQKLVNHQTTTLQNILN
jgi:hypothetical protein